MLLFTYSKLINYRVVIKEVKISHWWILACKIPRMQLKIRRVIKLIIGEHCLNSNPANKKCTTTRYVSKLCDMCTRFEKGNW